MGRLLHASTQDHNYEFWFYNDVQLYIQFCRFDIVSVLVKNINNNGPTYVAKGCQNNWIIFTLYMEQDVISTFSLIFVFLFFRTGTCIHICSAWSDRQGP